MQKATFMQAIDMAWEISSGSRAHEAGLKMYTVGWKAARRRELHTVKFHQNDSKRSGRYEFPAPSSLLVKVSLFAFTPWTSSPIALTTSQELS
jgi:hypothetical protein